MRSIGMPFICLFLLSLTGSKLQAQHYDDGHGHGTVEYHFGERHHTSKLANSLWNDVNAVCWEAHNHYRHESNWRETYKEMRSMLDDARHIRTLVRENYYHDEHEDDHIARDLHDMDKLFHHLQDDVADWHTDGSTHDNVHDDHDDYHGSAHGGHRDYYTNRGGLKVRMALLEETLHHMMKDYGVKSRIAEAPVAEGGGEAPSE